MAKVYVSSTISDLRRERRTVMDWLVAAGHQPVHSYRPDSATVPTSSLGEVASCDLYVLILGHRYGFQPEDDNPDGLSITHMEYLQAGQAGIPRVALLRTAIPDERLSDLDDLERWALVRAFRAQVAREVQPAEFHDKASLLQGLSTGVQAELARQENKRVRAEREIRPATAQAAGLTAGIFLSYRREQAGPYARTLQLQLSQRFPDATIFMDLDSIEAGLDFAEVIEEAMASCTVLVALIGQQWAMLTDEDGVPRLDNPDDFVRFEVQTALERGMRVIPVLIDGARPLRQQELPTELRKLARLNAHKLSWDRYRDDVDRLLDLIQRVLAAAGEQTQLVGIVRDEAVRKVQQEAKWPTAVQLARVTVKTEDAVAARDQYAALLPIEERVLGPEHPHTLDTRHYLANSTGEAGDAAGARDQYAALLPIRERVSGPEHPDTMTTRSNLAYWTEQAAGK